MPLQRDGRFECEACGVAHGYLPDDPPTGDPADLLGEMICTDCAQADADDTDTSYTGPDGHRHNRITDADVSRARAFYEGAGKTWEAPQAAEGGAAQPAAGQQGDGAATGAPAGGGNGGAQAARPQPAQG